MEGATLKVLHPDELKMQSKANDNSLVCLLVFGNTSFLFASDIQPLVQDEIIKLYLEVENADCVQVPHHGGKLSDDFVRYFKDKILVLSEGPNERGLPYSEYLEKLGKGLLRTNSLGTIVLENDGEKVRVLRD